MVTNGNALSLKNWLWMKIQKNNKISAILGESFNNRFFIFQFFVFNFAWQFPMSIFPHVRFILPHLHFHQNRQFSFSANLRQTQKLNKNSKFYYYKEYSLKVHVLRIRNGENWLLVGEIWLEGTSFRKWRKWVITLIKLFSKLGTHQHCYSEWKTWVIKDYLKW